MNPDDFWAGMSELDRNASVNAKQSYTDRLILAVLKAAGCEVSAARLAAHCERRTGSRYLSTRWFADTFVECPFALHVSADKSFSQIPLSAVFGAGFNKLPFVLEYDALVESQELDVEDLRQPLLVFRAGRADSASIMTLQARTAFHGAGLPVDLQDPDVGVTRIVRAVGRPMRLYIMSGLGSYLDAVGREWVSVHDL